MVHQSAHILAASLIQQLFVEGQQEYKVLISLTQSIHTLIISYKGDPPALEYLFLASNFFSCVLTKSDIPYRGAEAM